MKNKKAFTLVELLVVMAIMAILTTIGLSSFGTIREKSRDSKRKENLESIAKALEMYYNDWGHYPLAETDVAHSRMMGCGNGSEICNWGDPWSAYKTDVSNSTLYMPELPQDPSGFQYYYLTDSKGSYYMLFAYLENKEDSRVAKNSDGDEGFYQNTYCKVEASGGPKVSSCNYLVSSLNISVTTKPSIVNEGG